MSSTEQYTDELKERRRRDAHLIISRDVAEFSDMTIECRGVRFRCHKAIVCTQSATIKDCCKETPTKGGCIVKIKCHPLVFRMALEYFYTCDYGFYLAWDFPTRFLAEGQTVPVDPVDRLDCCELSLHLQVHVLAHCLRIPALKYFSAFNIARVLQRTSFPTVFPRFVREVYKTIGRKHALVKRLVVDHADKVIRESWGRNHYDGRFPRYLFTELEDFMLDFIAYRTVSYAPLDDCSTGYRISRSHWYC